MRAAAALRNTMSSSSAPRLFEGVFAINKPPSISSAQVVRDLQDAFRDSTTFKPNLDEERRKRDHENKTQKRRRRDKALRLKIGHGGTLDPLATGVLIIGVGRGTKHLQNFLSCTKSYTTSVLFGAATDTYDIVGKVLSKAPYEHVTREKVEAALGQFRGDIMQTPPIYSALSMNGKRLYEYAREGKELPREIEKRPVKVEKLEIVEWLDRHEWTWPKEEALQSEKELAEKVLHLDEVKPEKGEDKSEGDAGGEKRKREVDDTVGEGEPPAKRQQHESEEKPLVETEAAKSNEPAPTSTTEPEKHGEGDIDHASILPAVKLDMTVTSGFYVRSLCHDLGKAVESHGLMAALVRTRQGDYALGENVLDYEDLAKGEEVWGPKIKEMLGTWLDKDSGSTHQTQSKSSPDPPR